MRSKTRASTVTPLHESQTPFSFVMLRSCLFDFSEGMFHALYFLTETIELPYSWPFLLDYFCNLFRDSSFHTHFRLFVVCRDLDGISFSVEATRCKHLGEGIICRSSFSNCFSIPPLKKNVTWAYFFGFYTIVSRQAKVKRTELPAMWACLIPCEARHSAKTLVMA